MKIALFHKPIGFSFGSSIAPCNLHIPFKQLKSSSNLLDRKAKSVYEFLFKPKFMKKIDLRTLAFVCSLVRSEWNTCFITQNVLETPLSKSAVLDLGIKTLSHGCGTSRQYFFFLKPTAES